MGALPFSGPIFADLLVKMDDELAVRLPDERARGGGRLPEPFLKLANGGLLPYNQDFPLEARGVILEQ